MNIFLRLYNWFRRFRHRCGYGVHSPTDFYFITFVVYEKLSYYAYHALSELRLQTKGLYPTLEKIDRLLLRICNYHQPDVMIDYSAESTISTLYLREACKRSPFYYYHAHHDELLQPLLSSYEATQMVAHSELTSMLPQQLRNKHRLLLHIGITPSYQQVYEAAIPYVNDNTCIIISQPYATAEKKAWWQSVINDKRNTITFDLYHIGVVFFNSSRIKEHRIVNFF